MRLWGKLERCGGSEDSPAVPRMIPLFNSECFVGRFGQPVAGNSRFTHDTQAVIPCPIISSTHFCISVEEAEDGQHSYFIHDFSRNGTFLNDEVVGAEKKALTADCVISIKYNKVVKLAYKFLPINERTADSNNDDINGRITVKRKREEIEEEDEELAAEKKAKEAALVQEREDLSIEISVLRAELSAAHEEKTRIEQELEQQRVLATGLSATVETNQAVIAERDAVIEATKAALAEVQSTMEAVLANSAASEARVVVLADQLDEEKQQHKELKAKYAGLLEESKQFEQRVGREVDVAVTNLREQIALESAAKLKLEEDMSLFKEQLQEHREQAYRTTVANQALQEIITEMEQKVEAVKV